MHTFVHLALHIKMFYAFIYFYAFLCIYILDLVIKSNAKLMVSKDALRVGKYLWSK